MAGGLSCTEPCSAPSGKCGHSLGMLQRGRGVLGYLKVASQMLVQYRFKWVTIPNISLGYNGICMYTRGARTSPMGRGGVGWGWYGLWCYAADVLRHAYWVRWGGGNNHIFGYIPRLQGLWLIAIYIYIFKYTHHDYVPVKYHKNVPMKIMHSNIFFTNDVPWFSMK